MSRVALICCAVLLLQGCSLLSQSRSSSGDIVVLSDSDQTAITVTIPSRGASGLIVPVGRNGPVTTWRTSDNTAFSFRNGVLVSTRGLGDDLMAANVDHSLAAVRGNAANWAPRINTYMNSEYQNYFVVFQCRRSDIRQDTLRIADRAVPATRITETCVTDQLQVENVYWRSSANIIVRSRQWVSPGVGYMETERTFR